MFLIGGEILKPHGVRGELKVAPFTDNPYDFLQIKSIFFNKIEYLVERVRVNGSFIYLKLKDVDSRDDATKLKGEISVCKSEIPLKEGHFFIADLIGSRVFARDALLGKLIDVFRTGSVDTYKVATEKGNFTFPAIDRVIIEIDINEKIIKLDGIELDKVMVYEI